MLPHYLNLTDIDDTGGPGTKPQEPVYKNLFEITFVFPTLLSAQKRSPLLMLEQATSINLDLTPGIETTSQKFKYATRVFVKTPEKTHTEFDIKFNINVNSGGSMESWNTLKAWYDLVWNSQNGSLHYKADIIGTIIVNQHDRKGLVLRRVTLQNVQILSASAVELGWAESDILDVTGKFVADFWIDEYIDGNFSIDPPFVSGY